VTAGKDQPGTGKLKIHKRKKKMWGNRKLGLFLHGIRVCRGGKEQVM